MQPSMLSWLLVPRHLRINEYNVKITFMAVVIRLTKTGRKGERKYRIVVKEKRSKRDGKSIEVLGMYEKREKEAVKKINMDRYKYWMTKGAKPTTSVANIIKQ